MVKIEPDSTTQPPCGEASKDEAAPLPQPPSCDPTKKKLGRPKKAIEVPKGTQNILKVFREMSQVTEVDAQEHVE